MSNRKSKRTERDETMSKMEGELKPLHFPIAPQNSNPTSTQNNVPVEPQAHSGEPATSTQSEKTGKPQIYKWTTHLRADTIKAIKLQAVQEDKKDYEVAQEIFDQYYKLKEQ